MQRCRNRCRLEQCMQRYWKRIGSLLLVVAAGGGGIYLWQEDYLTFASIRNHQAMLFDFIRLHYAMAVIIYILTYLATALFLPGALVLTIAGGMMFGILPAVLFANIGATIGSVLAFLASRHGVGHWFQQRFTRQLESFNREISLHGPNYLLILRILPVVPFFVVNYGAGLTRISLFTFIWTTSAGMLPGCVIYSYLGSTLRDISQAEAFFSWKIILALVLLSLFALLPIILHHFGLRNSSSR